MLIHTKMDLKDIKAQDLIENNIPLSKETEAHLRARDKVFSEASFKFAEMCKSIGGLSTNNGAGCIIKKNIHEVDIILAPCGNKFIMELRKIE